MKKQWEGEIKIGAKIISVETGGYVVDIEELSGCIAQGETPEEAMEMIEIARKMWLEVALEEGMDITEPGAEDDYSGKFFIRAPKSLHRKLYQMAKREGTSLNQFLVATLSRAVGIREGREEYEAEERKTAGANKRK